LPKIRIISLLVLIIAITAITLPNFAQRALAASSDSSLFFTVEAETLVKADGPGGVDTYDLIRQKLGPSSIEAPDVFRNNHQGVRHIVENTGSPYGPYFTFILHDEDGNKDEVNSDRQRNEIKGDGSSPEKVLGRQGETARYHWYFRVAPNYKASNTIMFQLHNKDEGPIVKIESMGDNLVFRHDPDNCNCGKEAVLASHPFNVLRGQWLEAEVVTTYANSGYLLMTLRDQSGKVIMHTEKNKIDMWSSSFTRPKWGIYRGTKNFNDQDTIDFADFRIQEITLHSSPPPTPAPTPTPAPSGIVSNLTVASGKPYQVMDGGLASGAPLFIDRNFTFKSIPGSVNGSTYMKTANDDKGRTDTSFLSFQVNKDATVYVAYDQRATSLPNWLKTWNNTGESITTTDTTFNLFAKGFAASSTVTLGGNLAAGAAGANSNYFVVVTDQGTPIPQPINQLPTVDAGPDQTITLLVVANLTGTVTDDGLPNPPAAFTTTWSMVSGPGSVIFGNAGTPVTTASFSHAGEYILRLTASDSELSASDDVTINVEVVYGDSNQDGKLTAEDVHLALDWLFGQSPTPPSGSASFVATDVNNNGVIDGDDVRLMIDRLLSQP
jgi:hypothetical protein